MPGARSPGLAALVLAAALAGCGVTDDLFPSGRDRTPPVEAGTEGPQVGQLAPDFSGLQDTGGAAVSLHQVLQTAPGAVLYFTMWCPICDGHMSDIMVNAMPAFPDVAYFALDYVSGSWEEARAAMNAAGWQGAGFTVLADVGARTMSYYSAPMMVVIVGADHVVRYNGEYDWAKVRAVLEALP